MEYLIKTNRLGLRQWEDLDFEPFAELNADEEVRKYFPGLLSRVESDKVIQSMRKKINLNGFGFWALDVLKTGKFIGMVGITLTDLNLNFTPCIEIGWHLKKSAWGNGYATEAAFASLDFAINECGFGEIYSWTAKQNVPSENVMKKIGMEKVAEFNHPNIEDGHWLSPHLLYKINQAQFLQNQI